MLLSYNELVQLVKDGVINAPIEHINAASIDITLHDTLQLEREVSSKKAKSIDLMAKENLPMMSYQFRQEDACGHYFDLRPNEFILASSVEIFNLPNDISCEYMLKSSLARNGLEHLAAGWCDAGWNGSTLTLELKNMSQYYNLRLRPGMKIGQMKFFRHKPVPDHASYATRGQYNNDIGAQSTKELK